MARSQSDNENNAEPSKKQAWDTEKLRSGELEGGLFSGASLSGLDGREARLRGADLSRANLSGADLSGADLSGADLRWAQLAGAKLVGADLTGTRMSRAIAPEADFSEAKLVRTDCSDGEFRLAVFARATLDRADFTRADLRGCRFAGTTMAGTLLRRADVAESHWENAALDNADLAEASLHYSEWRDSKLERIQGRDSLWSAARMERVRFQGSDLRLADFDRVLLSEVTFSDCDVSETRFNGSRHRIVAFESCRLAGTIFKGTTVTLGEASAGPVKPSPIRVAVARLLGGWRSAQTVLLVIFALTTAVSVTMLLNRPGGAGIIKADVMAIKDVVSSTPSLYQSESEPETIRTRILCAGGSHTEGTGAPPELSYPKQLAALLNDEEPDHGYAVEIQANGGYNSSMAVNRVLDLLLTASEPPNVVVFNAGKNNEHNIQEAPFLPAKLRHAPFEDQLRYLSERASSLKLDKITQKRITDLIASGKPQDELGWDQLFDVTGEVEQRFLEAWVYEDLQRLSTELAKRKIPLFLINTWNPIGYVDRAYERARDDFGAVFVDAANFGAMPRNEPPSDALLSEDGHPNEFGYARIAELVSRAFKDNGVVASAAGEAASPSKDSEPLP